MPPLADFGTDAANMDAARQQLFLISAVYNDRREDVEAYLGESGVILAWQRQKTAWPPSWAIIQTAANKYFVVIEGTTNVSQALQHFWGSFGLSQDDQFVRNFGPWEVVSTELQESLAEFLSPPSRNLDLRIAGHSYGGAVAQLLGNHYRRTLGPESDIQVMTFGAPRAVTNQYSGPQPQTYWRIESTNDPVTALPPGETVPVLVDSVLSWFVPSAAAAWQHRGNQVILYPQGNTSLPTPPGPYPPFVTDAVPNAHFLDNYLGRLYGNYQLYGGSEASYLAVQLTEVILKNATPPIPVASLPPVFQHPPGVQQVIPLLPFFVRSLGVATVPVGKIDLMFVGPKGESWAESYSIEVPGLKSKQQLFDRLPDANQAFIKNRLAFLNRQCVLQSIRIGYSTSPRQSLIVPYNLIGTGGTSGDTDNEADVCSTAAVWNLYGAEFGQRKVWFRGLTDAAVRRDPTTGIFVLNPNTKTYMQSFLNAAEGYGCGVVQRSKPTEEGAGRKIGLTKVDGSVEDYPGYALVTTQEAHGWTGKMTVSFGLANKKNLPGLNGVFQAEVASANTFWIKYVTPLFQSVPAFPAYVRTVAYEALAVIVASRSNFAWATSRQVKSSFTRSRGARSARRLRNLA